MPYSKRIPTSHFIYFIHKKSEAENMNCDWLVQRRACNESEGMRSDIVGVAEGNLLNSTRIYLTLHMSYL